MKSRIVDEDEQFRFHFQDPVQDQLLDLHDEGQMPHDFSEPHKRHAVGVHEQFHPLLLHFVAAEPHKAGVRLIVFESFDHSGPVEVAAGFTGGDEDRGRIGGGHFDELW